MLRSSLSALWLARAAVLLVIFTTRGRAEDTVQPLTFTYQTFASGQVETTSFTYTLPASDISSSSSSKKSSKTGTPAHIPTSYSLNSADLAYPTFANITGPISEDSPAPGIANASTLANDAIKLVALFMHANETNCNECKSVMSTVKKRMEVQQETLRDIAIPFCSAIPALPYNECVGLLTVGSTDVGAAFAAMDMDGTDGQLVCAYMFGLCQLPPPPPVNTTALFNGTTKPKAKTLTPSKKDPLRVLHISDYHLDLRYVVGSEANCPSQLGGTVCCRVYPYTNVSASVDEPASLFGNYLCDTPDALATSVFRGVPKVTGKTWDDFAFGIFTGDLVSHDLWELTPEYVIAEQLQSYQEFFDGMGGMPMYPTLGNHDTYPQAFTSYPELNSALPKNASYSVQQQYNYEALAKAWTNYGWLSHSEAQQFVASGLGIYRTTTKEGLVIISINSDLFYYFNLFNYIDGNTADKYGVMAKLIDYLLDAEKADQPVWLIQHVPPGGTTDYESLPAPSDLYYTIVDRFSPNTIRGVFFGHTHADEFSVFYSNNGTNKSADTAVNTAWIMPSVTPYTGYNSGFRQYMVDAETFQIIDSITYYANVSNTYYWQFAGDVQWEFEYSARETYDYNNSLKANEPLSPAFWHNVAMEIAANETTYHKYVDLRSKQYRPYTAPNALEMNRTLCGLTSMSVPIFEDCLGSMDSTTAFL